MKTVAYDKLEQILTRIMTKAGLEDKDAEDVAKALTLTEAKGVFSHGAQLVDGYAERILSGAVNIHPQIRVTELGPSVAVVDGDQGMGVPVTRYATRVGIQKAKETGCATVCGRNLNHFGAGLVYADMAVAENMLFVLYCNTVPCVAPFGSREQYFGTNPYTFGAPCGKEHPFILDMATSVGAANKLIQLRREGKPAPAGWGIDSEGNPTTDIDSILRGGSLIPFGGPKGSGMAGLVGIMAGVASGSAYRNDVMGCANGDRPCNFGFMMQFVDVSKLMNAQEYNERAETYVRDILNLKPAKQGGKVMYPGYMEGEKLKKAHTDGIVLSEGTVLAVENAARRVGFDAASVWDD